MECEIPCGVFNYNWLPLMPKRFGISAIHLVSDIEEVATVHIPLSQNSRVLAATLTIARLLALPGDLVGSEAQLAARNYAFLGTSTQAG